MTELVVTGRAGVPANASAVVLNVTVTEPSGPGFVTVFPCGSPRPNASNVNYVAGTTVPNAVLAKVGAGGKVCIYTSGAIHLIVDVSGFFVGESVFAAVVPGRVLETRASASTVDGQFAAIGVRLTGSVTELPVAGRAGVPANASAVVLNVTVTEPDGPGFMTVYPCGSERPNASNLNFVAGQTIPNAVISKVGVDGKICLFVSNATHVLVDVNGFFPAGSPFASLVPGRVLDSRTGRATIDGQFAGIGARAAGSVTELQVGGRAGVPVNASTVVLNITVTDPTTGGFVTVYPCGTTRPNASNLNFTAGQTIPNAVITKTGAGGKICIYTSAQTDLITDTNGYFP